MEDFSIGRPDDMVGNLEKELLVGLTFNHEFTSDVLQRLNPWDFKEDIHQDIYRRIVRIKKSGEEFSLDSLKDALIKEDGLRMQDFSFLEDEEFKKSRDMSWRDAELYADNIQRYSIFRGSSKTIKAKTKREMFPQFTKSGFEEALLVGFAYNMDALQGVFLQAKTFDFYYGNHVVIFETMLDIMSEKRTMDLQLLLDRLSEEAVQNQNLKPSDYAFLTSSYNRKNREMKVDRAQTYLRDLRTCAGIRRLSKNAQDMTNVILDNHAMKQDELMALADRALHDIERTSEVHFQTFNWAGPVAKDVIGKLEQNNILSESFIPTDFKDLDDKIIGLYPGLIVLAGRPQMGASEFALNLAYRLSKQRRVLYFTTRDNRQDFTFKSLSLFTKLPLSELYQGIYPMEDLKKTAERISTHQLVADFSPDLSLEKIVALLKIFHSKAFDAVIIDDVWALQEHISKKEESRRKIAKASYREYIRMTYTGYKMPKEMVEDRPALNTRFNSRDRRLNSIAYTLSEIGKELKIPIIAVTGCASEVDDRQLADPRLGDVIGPLFENLGNPVLLFHRPAYYELYQKELRDPDRNSRPRKSERVNILVARNTRGPAPVTVQLKYYQNHLKFEDVK